MESLITDLEDPRLSDLDARCVRRFQSAPVAVLDRILDEAQECAGLPERIAAGQGVAHIVADLDEEDAERWDSLSQGRDWTT